MVQFACNRVCIVHGYLGRAANHWQKWLADECTRQGIYSVYPKLPEPARPELAPWLSKLREVLREVDGNTAFVAHSLGCPTVLQFLRTLEPLERVGPVILVSPSTPHRIKHQNLPVPVDFFQGLTADTIRECVARMAAYHVVYSSNDVFVDPVTIRALVRRIAHPNVQTHVLENAGHIAPPRYTELPLALDLLRVNE